MHRFPLVAVSACTRQLGAHPFHMVGDKYVRAVFDAAGALPMMLPALPGLVEPSDLLAHVDGLLLTGSPSNIEPWHYQGAPSPAGTLHDPARDACNLALIPAALSAGVPLLAICRGFQELNVALGGTLHACVHEVAPYQDHREPAEQPVAVQYAARQPLLVEPGGVLARLGLPRRCQVNSIHGQGIDRLAPGLRVEALAEDGLIEAVSLPWARDFALGVQFHPEWRVLEHPHYLTIFQAFGAACRQRAERRSTTGATA
ncbi:gamma-glutamyl-gamma-aminobutyrate hydrolase family protein [Pseudomonas sp. BCRC 81390]|uniref:gamma-glutamyl-gamma-aminobutyrate hydrolase family protein n=1 Tax=Pseudomonas sp. BCRC 81390 TaxID=3054778 RepID=UPI002592A1B8|nr:gamma-glutamyl-gamma-aminobutyrate hydrolase family protein [Pseudomonas sp. BCRC 81390]MDM3885697.1 gamma-glutamyl-gamma-aminobutyrate hydrolase family protein [Pseudomonas sp. BCRC 81390]